MCVPPPPCPARGRTGVQGQPALAVGDVMGRMRLLVGDGFVPLPHAHPGGPRLQWERGVRGGGGPKGGVGGGMGGGGLTLRRGGVVWRLQEAGRAGMRMWGSAWGGGRGGILGVPVGRRAWSPIMGSPQPGSPDPIHCDPTPPCPTASPPTAQSMGSPYPIPHCHPSSNPIYGVPIPHIRMPPPPVPLKCPHTPLPPLLEPNLWGPRTPCPLSPPTVTPHPTRQCHHPHCPHTPRRSVPAVPTLSARTAMAAAILTRGAALPAEAEAPPCGWEERALGAPWRSPCGVSLYGLSLYDVPIWGVPIWAVPIWGVPI